MKVTAYILLPRGGRRGGGGQGYCTPPERSRGTPPNPTENGYFVNISGKFGIFRENRCKIIALRAYILLHASICRYLYLINFKAQKHSEYQICPSDTPFVRKFADFGLKLREKHCIPFGTAVNFLIHI